MVNGKPYMAYIRIRHGYGMALIVLQHSADLHDDGEKILATGRRAQTDRLLHRILERVGRSICYQSMFRTCGIPLCRRWQFLSYPAALMHQCKPPRISLHQRIRGMCRFFSKVILMNTMPGSNRLMILCVYFNSGSVNTLKKVSIVTSSKR